MHAESVPPVINDVLASPGKPLDAATRIEMENHIGQDFSAIRVHTDAKAAASATMIDAQAYTVANEIVFGEDQYAPATTRGKTLLAHELTHVAQQRTHSVPGSPLKLAPSQTKAEAEAIEMSRHTGSPSPVARPRATVSVAPGMVQRTATGTLLGSVLGAVGGAILGAFAGGLLGAIVGGIAGAVGGALVGEHATTRRRRLTPQEVAFAREIFQDAIDYSRVEITRDSVYAAGAPRTLGNTINLKSSWNHFKGDTLELTDEGRETLIHELTHVWQYQNGGLAYIPLSLIAQIRASIRSGTRNAAYDWRAAHQAGLPWSEWNPEQQAQLIEDYNSALRRIQSGQGTGEDYQTVSIALPYLHLIRKRLGAPSFGRPTPPPDFLKGAPSTTP